MSLSASNELVKIKKFIDEGDHKKALELIDKFGLYKRNNLEDNLACQLLRCEISFQQGLFKEILYSVDRLFEESLKLGINPLSIDFLMWKARSLISLFELENIDDIINKADDLLKNLIREPSKNYPHENATIAFYKALYLYWEKRDANLALENLKNSLILRETLDNKADIILTNLQIAKILIYGKGDLDQANNYLKNGLTLATKINHKFYLAWGLLIKGTSYYKKGDLDHCIQLYEKSLRLYSELNNEFMMGNVLNNLSDVYRLKGELDRALELMEERLTLRSKSGSIREMAIGYDPLIQAYIQKGDIEQAKKNLNSMEKLIVHLKDKQINRWYLFDKALILKTSLRAKNRIQAEEILKQIIEVEDSDHELILRALLNLCELLLIELKITNDDEVLEEIKSIITQLLDTAEKQRSYWIWGEAFILQAELALLFLDLNEARRLLTKGQKIAEKYGLESLAIKISNKHDELLHKLGNWEDLQDSEADLSSRLKLTTLDEQIKLMIQNKQYEIPEAIEENPIMILIISEGGTPTFSNLFTDIFMVEDDLISGFLSAFNTFSGELFSEGLDRASFGEFTLVMKPISRFLACYIFKGHSFYAQKRIEYFIERLETNHELMNKFNEYHAINRVIELKDFPVLDSLISEVFLTKRLEQK